MKIAVDKAGAQLSELIRHVNNGESVSLVQDGKEVARLIRGGVPLTLNGEWIKPDPTLGWDRPAEKLVREDRDAGN